jgi:hypothetical protein
MAGNEFQSDPPARKRRPAPRPRQDDDYDDVEEADDVYDDPVQTLVPYRNVRALLAYYFGVFSLVPVFGILLSPVAMLLGILGYRYGRLHPSTKGTGHAAVGILFGLVGLAINAALLAWAWTYIQKTGPIHPQPGGPAM